MTAQRSKAEVDRLLRIGGDRLRRLEEINTTSAALEAVALNLALKRVVCDREISNEVKFNVLRDAIASADREIDRYHNTEAKS
ncbi:MAG: hypothetical protein IKE69_07985 [Thermoguttaceae bacterium]|nr:hypothetical protein [Thermoguttaceae bacterium]